MDTTTLEQQDVGRTENTENVDRIEHTEETINAEEKQVSSRDAAMERIIAARRTKNDAEQGQGQEVIKPEQVTVKIDGVEKDVPLKDVVANYQKNTVADQRLKAASIAQKKAEQRLREVTTRERATAVKTPPTPPIGMGLNKLAENAYLAIYDDDKEKAVRSLEALVRGSQPAPSQAVDHAAIVEEVELRASNRQFNANSKIGLQKFKTEYSDVWNDPILRGLANQRTIAAQEEQALRGLPPEDPWSIMVEAGDSIRAWVSSKTREPTNGQMKTIKKEALSRSLKPSGGRSTIIPVAEKPQTRREILQEMVKSRNRG